MRPDVFSALTAGSHRSMVGGVLHRLLVVVFSLTLFGFGSAEASAAPITAESLLAAGVSWPTVRQVAGSDWWPQVPQFESPPLFHDALPAQPAVVTSQWFAQVGGDATIQVRLLAFRGAPRYCRFLVVASGVERPDFGAPAVGTSHAYWTTVQEDGSPAAVLCFERGSVAVEIKVLGAKWGTARIALLGRPVDANVQALLGGRLAAAHLSASLLARLPRASAAPGLVLGTAVLANEAWAANAGNPPPKHLLAQLVRGGSKSLLYRRYVLADETNVIDVTLFTFSSASAAGGWFRTLDKASSLVSLELGAGATGKQSLLRSLEEYVVLDLVAGTSVADITCYAPGGEAPSGACEGLVRKLGERWYAALSQA